MIFIMLLIPHKMKTVTSKPRKSITKPAIGAKRRTPIGTTARIIKPVRAVILPILALCAIISFLMYLSVMSINIKYTGVSTIIIKLNSKEYPGIRDKLMSIGIKLIKQRYIIVLFFIIIPPLENLLVIFR